MAAQKNKSQAVAELLGSEIRVTRHFDAPRELVWEMWTNPMHVSRWWGPNGFSTTIKTMDVKPGGKWIQILKGPDGTLYPNESTFIEIVKPEKIVYTHGGSREGADRIEFHSTWTFKEENGGTRLTISMIAKTADTAKKIDADYGAVEGGKQTLERLAEHLEHVTSQAKANEKGLYLKRTFSAPLDLVWCAFTDPEHLKHWWGPKDFTNPRCEIDVRVGGQIRIDMQGPDGIIYPMAGAFQKVEPKHTIVFSGSPIDKDGNQSMAVLHTFKFSEKAGKTEVIWQSEVSNISKMAPSHLAGMRKGMNQNFDRYVEYVENKM